MSTNEILEQIRDLRHEGDLVAVESLVRTAGDPVVRTYAGLETVCPVLWSFFSQWWEHLSDSERSELQPLGVSLLDTRGDIEWELARRRQLRDWLVQVYTPLWLASFVNLSHWIGELSKLEGATDPRARPVCFTLRQTCEQMWQRSGTQADKTLTEQAVARAGGTPALVAGIRPGRALTGLSSSDGSAQQVAYASAHAAKFVARLVIGRRGPSGVEDIVATSQTKARILLETLVKAPAPL